MSKLKLSEFDLYGTFRLTQKQTAGIENLVQKLGNNKYLSRNASYYPTKSRHETGNACFRDICNEYAQLNSLLPMSGKPAFVVCEKMHELAVRVVNTIQQTTKAHLFQDGEHFDTVAQKCAQECADNLVRLINNQPAAPTTTNLRDETTLRPDSPFDRKIAFADNKKQLYMCANALPDDAEHLITPGRGSSKLGTLVQSVRRQKGLKPLGFTQIYYSLYGNEQYGPVFATPLKNLPEKLLVMDDTIYKGYTLSRIKEELTRQGHQVTNGAVTASFYNDTYASQSIFQRRDWAHYIDIIPNQYARPGSDQMEMDDCLKLCSAQGVNELRYILSDPRNGAGRHTADYHAMRMAEVKASAYGANLYQVSDKISPAAVDYNKKIRAQVEAHNIER